ncbi:MAG TPA: hypothetical protein DGB85_09450 [Deltaproteobacteria bacterium]|nr:hypothetical protein [Deltaproteobacteria bacterium]|tara:strand:- start:90 stop:371 length:282 start_codon:yes stop_codon:yes gene_type:complete
MFEANDIHKTGAALPKTSFGNSRRTGFTIGIIKAVVVLLSMNIEKNCYNDHYTEHEKFWILRTACGIHELDSHTDVTLSQLSLKSSLPRKALQ